MAIVADRAGIGTLDKPLETPNRSNAGTPIAALTPQYSGEIVLDTTNRQLWQAYGTTNNDWMPVDVGIAR